MAAGESKTGDSKDGGKNGQDGRARIPVLSRCHERCATQGSPSRLHRCHGRSAPYVEGYDHEESIEALAG